LIDPNTILISDFKKPIAILRVPWCTVFKYVDINVSNDMLCDGDKILVDGSECEIREVEMIGAAGGAPRIVSPKKKSSHSSGPLVMRTSPDFTRDQFSAGFSAAALLREIGKESRSIAGRRTESGTEIEELNAILKTPGFVDGMKKKHPSVEYDDYTSRLIAHSENYRKKEFSELNGEQQKVIKKLNRMVMETVFPRSCPKIFLSPETDEETPPESQIPPALRP
jgi:hypothetical protein